MQGYSVEYYKDSKGNVYYYKTGLKAEDRIRQTGIVESAPSMTESQDWYVVVRTEDGTFRSLDVYCLKLI